MDNQQLETINCNRDIEFPCDYLFTFAVMDQVYLNGIGEMPNKQPVAYCSNMLSVLKSSDIPHAISIGLQDDGWEAIQDSASVV